MKFVTFKSESNKKKLLISLVVFIVIILAIVITTSLAKYKITQSIPLVSGSISYSPNDIIIETYVNNELRELFPTKGTAEFIDMNCTKEVNAIFDEESWSIKISNITKKGIKCTLNFSSNLGSSAEYILSNKNVDSRSDFTTILTTDTTGIVFTAEDNDGKSYYYAGSPTDNWFYFGGYYWRIVRINGDGTVRLIYQGTGTSTTGISTQISTSAWNTPMLDNAYQGYMYGSLGASSYEETHSNGNDSSIKQVLDSWYTNNLASNSVYLDGSAGFCNDRKIGSGSKSGHGTLGYGTNKTVYAAGDRIWTSSWDYLSPQEPTLKCEQQNDLFTLKNSSKGNGALDNPIGLITIDEIIYAGAYGSEENTAFYLYTAQDYWTMTPGNYDGTGARILRLSSVGGYNCDYANVSLGVRPVINLRADLKLSGNGTSSNPYVIKGTDVPQISAKDKILSDKVIATRNDFSVVLTEDTTGTIYSAEDDDGTSYYFAGAPTDNYVKFAGFYWRIIRVNGDGTIRMIYDGATARDNGVSDSNTQIGNSAFNTNYEDNAYEGFMYTIGSLHGLGTNSVIKEAIDTWYNNNLTNYVEFIDENAGFCGDREPSTSKTSINGSGGTGTTTTYYAGYIRLSANKSPSLKCINSNDLYTLSSSSKGNKVLNKPIGLITADEVSFVGGVNGVVNKNYYLYTGQTYWTISPFWSDAGTSLAFRVSSSGILNGNVVNYEYGIRPVINLKQSTIFLGSGTSSDPYVVKGAE